MEGVLAKIDTHSEAENILYDYVNEIGINHLIPSLRYILVKNYAYKPGNQARLVT